eukprot:GDKI01040604.1.p2 GENE.GDKI01040604.1~~GDKI01040604.1.p2  ORF type:complete len:107 (-),score=41.07 GDKI01040604.1:323-604(-)
MVHAARLCECVSGRVLDVHTTQPGVQLYTGNWLEGSPGKQPTPYTQHAGVCLECQAFPDTHNQKHAGKNFPSVELHPGEVYREHIVFGFGVCV